ncbi:MAG: S41 family peptidase [Bacteroidales bacterium]|jgi:carboxyl-terminal processing protease|nr:S41 family peptidase [Bacteroidales bacterium]
MYLYKKRKKTLLYAAAIVITIVAFWSFKDGDDFKIAKSLDIYYSLFRDVNIYYVDETDPETMVENSIKAMLEKLDPYTIYIPEKDKDDFDFMVTGQYGGIGALIRNNGEYPIVAQPYKGFPADKAGLKAGDIILEIDGMPMNDYKITEVSDRLKGIPQTKLKLLIERPYSSEKIEKEIIREEIKISSIPYYGVVDESIGYIRVTKFTPDVTGQVKDALRTLKAEHQITSLIVDMRGNPGGLLNEAPKLCNLFVDKGEEIVSTKGKVKKWNQTLKTTDFAYDTEIPLIILVSRGSASSTEIVAGALQDLDRAVILGQKTFGKGLVQTSIPLSYNAQVKVTTAKYYIPSGRCVQALDYTHRNEDGSVGHVPDSLISEFTTKNGRKVYDGGGITPDISIKAEKLSQLSISLIVQNVIFDYATKFAYENPTIPGIKDFDITDEIYKEFIQFALLDSFKYETQSETELLEFEKIVKREKYYDRAKDELDNLRAKLVNDKETDLKSFKPEVVQFLRDEIVGRYYYEGGQIQTNLKDDIQLHKAIEILKDQKQYKSILSSDFVNIEQLGMKMSMLDGKLDEKSKQNDKALYWKSAIN